MATMPAAATGGVIVFEHELEQSAMNMSLEQYPAEPACLNVTKPCHEDVVYADFDNYAKGKALASGLPGNNTEVRRF